MIILSNSGFIQNIQIHQNFPGGNIRVVEINGQEISLNNELRDTAGEWFYWAFCIEGAAGQTLTFRFPRTRLGYAGPAVSHDLQNWTWLGTGEEPNAFTYTFSPDEHKVYFAHHMLYPTERFDALLARHGLCAETLCLSRKGRAVPYLRFGSGTRRILLTARHHACESPGNYVLEGVLESLITSPLPDTEVICVPFVDYDGVLDGDQGKNRVPYDHNRDYSPESEALYAEVAAIRAFADAGVCYAFDFHAPYHTGRRNDTVFVVRNHPDLTAVYNRFSQLLADAITEDALRYFPENDIHPGVEWNAPDTPCFGVYMNAAGAALAFSLETTYFGLDDNRFTQEKALALGRCFARALAQFDAGEQ